MFKLLRQQVIQTLWTRYYDKTTQMQLIGSHLKNKGIEKLFLDHFAVIDLPGPHSGIPHLKKIFSFMGYQERGRDYLAAKQNDFLWMAEQGCSELYAKNVLPQVVVADFRLDEMPAEIKNIIVKYAHQATPFPWQYLQKLQNEHSKNLQAQHLIHDCISQYFTGRDWPLPTLKEFNIVHAFNELLAWVLVFGRQPNHFTLSIHLLNHFLNLVDFNELVEHKLQLTLNQDGGKIKGGERAGIAQSSTTGVSQQIELADGFVHLPVGFVEFVWRYPQKNCSNPTLWNDYFTDFIAQHADRVIESLYTEKTQS